MGKFVVLFYIYSRSVVAAVEEEVIEDNTEFTLQALRLYGNWCGPSWTDGEYSSTRSHLLSGGEFDGECIDELDCACRDHDRDCAHVLGCSKSGDIRLISTALKIAGSPRWRMLKPHMAQMASFVATGMIALLPTRRH